ncbi:hypothetical protein DTO166G4_6612 [Paecilomyces variotii]|uniref:ditrans,polycis-polyprenyl diphosphate synthase [(2E,6E)-farnesyldiphosphate specific] n=1 Tax=Byssochlamys spectabilis TaxID=264951 RepID=A0A443I5W5_BYSSP|nr:putative undecaprenyl diphosphate synthase [Paecilomyces variotii]KAJ9191454.1 hypothetical protein DTO032I3_8808 [Paecilomyces variotii]KAJ9211839.1 hypothetical protein DTO166G4_6612 [Paecilomyces variotii]KAJ9224374.1 hypothetical protein DTO169C6_3205 [Paecilomyces variotii]KAJ9229370.1 hypothetical protein DTO166G5_7952 [Paecilomyces variotii]KAJ9232187.1 hypothetical protein DTO169E5_7658 [Paecilomyces variotii]
MVSTKDAELLRRDVRTRGTSLSVSDRERIVRSYLPEPSELRRTPRRKSGRKQKPTPIRNFVKSQLHLLLYTLIHICFSIYVRLTQSYRAVVDRILAILYYHHHTPELIQKDVKGLNRLPEHLSVVLSLRKQEDALEGLMDEVAELAAWSACAGIPTLSIYEKSGILKSYIPVLHQVVTSKLASYYGPPSHQPTLLVFAPHHPVYRLSDVERSENKHNPATLTILLLSAPDGRETLVDLTKTLTEMAQNGKLSPDDISTELIDAEISEITSQPTQNGDDGLLPTPIISPEPDLLLIFGPYVKLDGYPPWQIRLTEIFCTGDRSSSITGGRDAVEYQGFLRGLCRYARAQMRFGR